MLTAVLEGRQWLPEESQQAHIRHVLGEMVPSLCLQRGHIQSRGAWVTRSVKVDNISASRIFWCYNPNRPISGLSFKQVILALANPWRQILCLQSSSPRATGICEVLKECAVRGVCDFFHPKAGIYLGTHPFSWHVFPYTNLPHTGVLLFSQPQIWSKPFHTHKLSLAFQCPPAPKFQWYLYLKKKFHIVIECQHLTEAPRLYCFPPLILQSSDKGEGNSQGCIGQGWQQA